MLPDLESLLFTLRSTQLACDVQCFGIIQVAGMVSQAISRMEADVAKRKDNEAKERQKQVDEKSGDKAEVLKNSKGWYGALRARPLWRSKSTSFTREPDW